MKLKVNFSQRRKLAPPGDRAALKANPLRTGERSQKPCQQETESFSPIVDSECYSTSMPTLLIVLLLILLLGGGGFYLGGPAYGGGGIGVILVICLILYLMGVFR